MKNCGKNCQQFFCKNVSILLLFPHKLCIKSPFRIYVEVYSNLLCVDSDYLTKENVGEGISDAVLNLKQAEAFTVFLGDLPSYLSFILSVCQSVILSFFSFCTQFYLFIVFVAFHIIFLLEAVWCITPSILRLFFA